MVKRQRLIPFTLILMFIATIITFTLQAMASDNNLIPGIDYNRITQKVTAGSKSYPVELTLGELTFNGELVGSHGLDADELNTIINAVLKEKGLTADRVALVSQIAARIEKDAALYWGDQIIEGLLSYIPTFNIPVGINDYYVYMVHGKEKTIADTAKDFALDRAVSAAEKAIEKPRGMMGKLNKLSGSTRSIPMLGEMINTLKVASGWLSGNERFDNYLKLLEENLAEINDFYTTCSRRANDLAEQKGEVNSWQIKFNESTAVDTFSFWGIDNLSSEWTLSGELTKVSGENITGSGNNVGGNVDNNNEGTPVNNIFILIKDEDDILNYPIGVSSGVGYGMSGLIPEFTSGSGEMLSGKYEGTLTLNIKGLDMSQTFDTDWVGRTTQLPSITYVFRSAKSMGGYHIDEPLQTTILERSITGNFSLHIPKMSSGTFKSELLGNFSNSDNINFQFNHKVDRVLPIRSYVYGAYMTSNDINTITLKGFTNQFIGREDWLQLSGGPATISIGTVWQPLESTPTLSITFE